MIVAQVVNNSNTSSQNISYNPKITKVWGPQPPYKAYASFIRNIIDSIGALHLQLPKSKTWNISKIKVKFLNKQVSKVGNLFTTLVGYIPR